MVKMKFILVTIFYLLNQQVLADETVGSIKGKVDVNHKGQLSYYVPIDLIPSALGVKPDVALGFNAGYAKFFSTSGWYLSPNETIERCIPQYKSNKQEPTFCINGEELVLIDGVFGEIGSEYRSYYNSINKVVKTDGGFEVISKSRDITYYETKTLNQEHEVVIWSKSLVEDANGNTISYNYYGNDYEKKYLKSISYGANINTNLTDYRFVEFLYQDTNYDLPKFYFGTDSNERMILSQIVIKSFDRTVWTYSLSWHQLSSSKYILNSLTKCSATDVCLPPQEFVYEGVEHSIPSLTAASYGNLFSGDLAWNKSNDNRISTDLNYDGYPDLLAFRKGQIHYSYGSESGYTPRTALRYRDMARWEREFPVKVGDLDYDGYADVVQFDREGYTIIKGNSSGFEPVSQRFTGIVTPYVPTALRELTDFDGDRDLDLIHIELDGTYLSEFDRETFSFKAPVLLRGGFQRSNHDSDWHIYFVDVNNDGENDFLSYTDTDVMVALRQGDGYTTPRSWSRSSTILVRQNINYNQGFSDFNQDGYTDIYMVNNRGLYVAFSTGTSFLDPILVSETINARTYSGASTTILAHDFNNDGTTDIVVSRGNKLYWLEGSQVLHTTALETELDPGFRGAINPRLHDITLSDFDNDSDDDIIIFNSKELQIIKNENTNPRLVSIRDGYQNVTTISYQNTRGSVIIEPPSPSLVDVIRPEYKVLKNNIFVVTSISSVSSSGYHETLRYSYKNPTVNVVTYRFAGFEEKTEISETKKLKNTTKYKFHVGDVEFLVPFVKESYVKDGEDYILQKTNEMRWESINKGGYFQVTRQGEYSQEFDLDGSLLLSTQIQYEYDEFQNVTFARTIIGDKYGTYETTSRNTYANDFDNWIGDRLVEIVVDKKRGSDLVTRKTSFAYDNNGLVSREVKDPGTAFSVEKIYTRNNLRQITSTTTKLASSQGLTKSEIKSTNTYDQYGFVIEQTNDLGHKSQVEYDRYYGVAKKAFDANGNWEENYFNSWGSVTSSKNNLGLESSTFAEWCDSRCDVVGAAYFIRSFSSGMPEKISYFDSVDREIKTLVQAPDGRWLVKDFSYREDGLIQSESEGYFTGEQRYLKRTIYDQFGRIEDVIEADGSHSKISYDGLNYTTEDALGRRTTYIKNANDETLEVFQEHDPVGTRIRYTYNADGRVTSIHYGDSSDKVTITYDLLGRTKTILDPLTGLTEFSYNGLDLIYRQIKKDGQISTFNYDSLGRKKLVERSLAGKSEQVLFTWDNKPRGIGLIGSKTIGQYSEDYFYDQFSRSEKILYQNHGVDVEAGFSYDSFGRIQSKFYSTGLSLSYEYDDNGYMTAISDGDSHKTYFSILEYNNRLQASLVRYGNDIETQYERQEENGRLKRIHSTNRPDLIDFSFSYDKLGNVKSRSYHNQNFTEHYSYDEDYQLIGVDRNGTRFETNTYDNRGNITQIDFANSERQYVYGGLCNGVNLKEDQLCQIIEINTGSSKTYRSYQYDRQGRVLQDGERSLTYGLNGKVASIRKGNQESSFIYGPADEKIVRTDKMNGTTSQSFYFGGELEVLLSQDEVIFRHYVDDVAQVDIKDGKKEISYLHTDTLGTPLLITGDSKEIKLQQLFDVWGARIKDKSSVNAGAPLFASVTTRGFTNHEMLDEIGLIHMNGRVYDPDSRRFMSPDKFVQNSQERLCFNRYAYGNNNPASGTDPSGYLFDMLRNAGGKLYKWLSQNIRQIIATAVFIVACIYNPFAAGSLYSYLYVGAASYATTYYATNGNHDAALRGCFTAMAFHGIGSIFESTLAKSSMGGFVQETQALTHGVAGGIASFAGGGKFEHGFLAGVAGSYLSSKKFYKAIGAGANSSATWRAIVAVSTAGAVSELAGGSFEDGIIEATYIQLLNHLSHPEAPEADDHSQDFAIDRVEGSGSVKQYRYLDDSNHMTYADGHNVFVFDITEGGLQDDYVSEIVVFGGAGMLRSGARATFGMGARGSADELITVSRWQIPASQSLKDGDWVVRGGKNVFSYLMSGKFTPFNKKFHVSFKYGREFKVSRSTLRPPSGIEKFKTLWPWKQSRYYKK